MAELIGSTLRVPGIAMRDPRPRSKSNATGPWCRDLEGGRVRCRCARRPVRHPARSAVHRRRCNRSAFTGVETPLRYWPGGLHHHPVQSFNRKVATAVQRVDASARSPRFRHHRILPEHAITCRNRSPGETACFALQARERFLAPCPHHLPDVAPVPVHHRSAGPACGSSPRNPSSPPAARGGTLNRQQRPARRTHAWAPASSSRPPAKPRRPSGRNAGITFGVSLSAWWLAPRL